MMEGFFIFLAFMIGFVWDFTLGHVYSKSYQDQYVGDSIHFWQRNANDKRIGQS